MVNAVWGDTPVGDNVVEYGVWSLRKQLREEEDRVTYIETKIRKGYRWVMPVDVVAPRRPLVSLEARLAPCAAFADGTAAIEALDLDTIATARPLLAGVLRDEPEFVPGLIGMGMVCALLYESTRADEEPDRALLQEALIHAERACDVAPKSGEALGALSFVWRGMGDLRRANMAVRMAMHLEPTNWHHPLRLATVSWGEECMRAAQTVLDQCPGLGWPCWFQGRLLIPRQKWQRALDVLVAGCAAQDAQRARTGGFHVVGLHLLHAAVLASLGRLDEALLELERERQSLNPRHVYARECAAHAWYWTGAILLRLGRGDEAAAAFRAALTFIPTHALSAVGLWWTEPSSTLLDLAHLAARDTNTVDAVIVKSAVLSRLGRRDEAARLVYERLAAEPPGWAGWQLAADPLINAVPYPEAWGAVLALLRDRAL